MFFRNQAAQKRWSRLTERQQSRLLIVIAKAERAARGDSYATEAEFNMIVNDPFAFTDMNLTTLSGEQLLRLPDVLLQAIAEER